MGARGGRREAITNKSYQSDCEREYQEHKRVAKSASKLYGPKFKEE